MLVFGKILASFPDCWRNSICSGKHRNIWTINRPASRKLLSGLHSGRMNFIQLLFSPFYQAKCFPNAAKLEYSGWDGAVRSIGQNQRVAIPSKNCQVKRMQRIPFGIGPFSEKESCVWEPESTALLFSTVRVIIIKVRVANVIWCWRWLPDLRITCLNSFKRFFSKTSFNSTQHWTTCATWAHALQAYSLTYWTFS